MVTFWLIAILVLLALEAVTVSLVSIWFALGAFAAFLSSLFGGPLWLQIFWFFAVSILTLIPTRSLAKKYINAKTQPTNADRMIGMHCIVTERIDNLAATGAVSVAGKYWTARASSDTIIEEGETVVAQSIEGVKLLVARIPDTSTPVSNATHIPQNK